MKLMFNGEELVLGGGFGTNADSLPVGSLTYFLGSAAPGGYLACDGAEYSITDYPDLADFIEKQFGAKNHFGGDGETTFAVPDFRGKFLLGVSETHELLESGGEEEVTLTIAQIPSHTHVLPVQGGNTSGNAPVYESSSIYKAGTIGVQAAVSYIGSNKGHENMPPYTAVLICIKAKNTASSGGSAPAGSNIPAGGIIIWSGSADAVPDGWALCDGENGTPDLRDRFVLGAGETHAVGETGGEEEVKLTTAQMPRHNHSIYTAWTNGGTNAMINTSSTRGTSIADSLAISDAGSSKAHENMPPYFTLCYIMKT